MKNLIKTNLVKYPRLYEVCRRSYHFANFRSIAKNKIKIAERNLRLYKYFEYVYSNELDYLRQHCKDLEKSFEESKSITHKCLYFPKVDFEKSTPYSEFCSGSENSYIKHYLTKNRWAGLSSDQAFYLEATSLKRLWDIREISRLPHFPFPVLHGVSEQEFIVKMSYCGWSLDQLPIPRKPIKVNNHIQQIENIVNMLIKAKIMHLDLRSDGKNLCIEPSGKLSLIDFDIVVINNECPLSWQIARRKAIVKRFPEGYYNWAFNKINRALLKHKDKLELL
ncbi:hypothetical protein [Marinobacter piscensis]|uniref:hypothetical protein n=1 Tax=Marinobacter piscensis TaxID=1562308 RepID=UPI0011A1BC94|nr:hypothetical protein [Marinobacter piscensis]